MSKNTYTRQDKLEWLRETCGDEWLAEEFVNELVRWMGEAEFEEFYSSLCSYRDIKRDPNDPNYDAEVDSMDD
jgi:hypothetical protein